MKTESDAVIEEIRESRRRMSEEAGHDLHKYFENLKKFNLKYSAQVERYRTLHAAASAESSRGS